MGEWPPTDLSEPSTCDVPTGSSTCQLSTSPGSSLPWAGACADHTGRRVLPAVLASPETSGHFCRFYCVAQTLSYPLIHALSREDLPGAGPAGQAGDTEQGSRWRGEGRVVRERVAGVTRKDGSVTLASHGGREGLGTLRTQRAAAGLPRSDHTRAASPQSVPWPRSHLPRDRPQFASL